LQQFIEANTVPKQSHTPTQRTAPAPTTFKFLNGIKLREAWAEKGISPHD
jgi:hypothetical protein